MTTSEGPYRLLLLAAEFPPLGGGGVMRVTKMVKYLAPLGWEITVVACDEPSPATLDPSLLAEIPASVTIHRVRGPLRFIGASARPVKAAAGRGSLARRAVGLTKSTVNSLAIPDRWAGWAWAVSRLPVDRLGRPDVILSSGPPHSVHLAAARLSRRLGVPFVMDLRDDWTDNPLYRRVVPWQGPLDLALERWVIRQATRVTVISESSRLRHLDRHPRLRGRLVVMPNGFDPADLPLPAVRDDSRPLVFLHAGSIHGRRDPGPFAKAFASAVARPGAPRMIARFVGSVGADQASTLRTTIRPAALLLEGPATHGAAMTAMGEADVLLLITNREEGGASVMTGKVFEYLAVRRPVLVVAPDGVAGGLVRSAGAGLAVDPGDASGIEAAIIELATLAREGSFRGAPDELLARFDRRRQADAWSSLLREVAGRRGIQEAAQGA